VKPLSTARINSGRKANFLAGRRVLLSGASQPSWQKSLRGTTNDIPSLLPERFKSRPDEGNTVLILAGGRENLPPPRVKVGPTGVGSRMTDRRVTEW